MHYYKRNIGEYHKKAGKLSILEHGAYTLLLDACYDRERFPTLDEAIDWCWARSDEEVAAVKFVLRKFFTFEDGHYVQNRIGEELERYKANSLINKEIAINREKNRRQKKTRIEHEPCTFEHEPPPKQEPINIKHKTINNIKKNIQKKIGTRLPDDWRPTQDYVDAAKDLNPNYSPDWFRDTSHKFRDYWISKSGKDAIKTNWLATWRNWVRNNLEFRRGKQNAKPQQLDNDSTEWIERAFGSTASGDFGKQDIQFIEGDFSSVGGSNTGSGLSESSESGMAKGIN